MFRICVPVKPKRGEWVEWVVPWRRRLALGEAPGGRRRGPGPPKGAGAAEGGRGSGVRHRASEPFALLATVQRHTLNRHRENKFTPGFGSKSCSWSLGVTGSGKFYPIGPARHRSPPPRASAAPAPRIGEVPVQGVRRTKNVRNGDVTGARCRIAAAGSAQPCITASEPVREARCPNRRRQP